jgi:Raf kinase inhibitor-like YbhB/YbcL family protein
MVGQRKLVWQVNFWQVNFWQVDLRRIICFGLMGFALAGCIAGNRSVQNLPETANPMNFQSPAFDPGSTLPAKHTCDGEDISPPLRWNEPPEGTQSLVLIADDPDAADRFSSEEFVHWVMYDIPPEVRELPEALPPDPILFTAEVEGVQGKNDFDRYGYSGPCPPTGIHRYTFKLYALDTFLDLPPGATKDEVLAAMADHVLAESTIEGKYSSAG